ncbi:hypothetical protein IWQ60_007314 [Tieghemiomyces parasiticus]|uniref:DUF4112 domain-containing protein n=1 Tax=Tieghemiomyces parasiticus TaxID=78921 RepID=A0A9W8A425_9FUNG|nr:hypothetical protein IWQ60_007314 [Tieghemiomyces parasiticus]
MARGYSKATGRSVSPIPAHSLDASAPFKHPVSHTPFERADVVAPSVEINPLAPSGQATVVDLYNQINEDAGFNPEVFRAKRVKIEKMARLMDAIPGLPIKIGLDSLIGLLPVGGDAVSTVIAMYIVNLARQAGVPKAYRKKMIRNVVVNGLGGITPLVGDIFAIIYRSNIKNLKLLDKWAKKAQADRASQWQLLAAQNPHLRLESRPAPESLKDAQYLDQCIAAGIPFEPTGPSAAKARGRWKFWAKKSQTRSTESVRAQ